VHQAGAAVSVILHGPAVFSWRVYNDPIY